jgi:hypothetical protein
MSSRTVLASGLFVVALADGCRAPADATSSPQTPQPAPAETVQVDSTPPAEPPTAEPPTERAPAADTPAVVSLASLGPFYDASIEHGWLVLLVDADAKEWERVAEKSWDPMWAGNPALPKVLREFPPIYVVWRGGVVRRDAYARAGVDTAGWKIDYRPKGIKGPVLAMANSPPEGTSLSPGAKVTRIRKSHAMAVRMVEILAAELDASTRPRGRLKTFELQTTAGRFRAADRVIAVSGWAPPPPDDEMGDEFGLVFTADAAANRVQQVSIMSGLTTVVGLIDVDGDGVDEILTETRGYEFGSHDLHRLTPSGVETITLWEHNE